MVARSAGTIPPATPGVPNAPSRYLLASRVPPNWIPLFPVQLADPTSGRILSRLRRGAVLPDGSTKIHPALGQVLSAAQPLLLYDEEVPREGVHVTVLRRLARWTDGSTHVWTAYRRSVGRSEGSSGLRFDQAIASRPMELERRLYGAPRRTAFYRRLEWVGTRRTVFTCADTVRLRE